MASAYIRNINVIVTADTCLQQQLIRVCSIYEYQQRMQYELEQGAHLVYCYSLHFSFMGVSFVFRTKHPETINSLPVAPIWRL